MFYFGMKYDLGISSWDLSFIACSWMRINNLRCLMYDFKHLIIQTRMNSSRHLYHVGRNVSIQENGKFKLHRSQHSPGWTSMLVCKVKKSRSSHIFWFSNYYELLSRFKYNSQDSSCKRKASWFVIPSNEKHKTS